MGVIRSEGTAPNDVTGNIDSRLELVNRGAGGNPYRWAIYTAAVGGGFGVQPNGWEVWEYPGSATPACCIPRFRINPSGGSAVVPGEVVIDGGGRVGIGTTAPHPGARLHVVGGGTQGALLPQVALTSATAWAPVAGTAADGMVVYNTATAGTGANAVSPGYYYWRNGRWRRFIENGYAGMVQGVMATPSNCNTSPQNLTISAPSWQYLNSYIDLPPGRWIVFSTQIISVNSYLSNASIWVRTSFSDSPTTYSASPDIIGSTLISGILPPASLYNLVVGQVIINNTTGATKRYYYWGHKDPYNTTLNPLNFSTTCWGENQLFAIPAE